VRENAEELVWQQNRLDRETSKAREYYGLDEVDEDEECTGSDTDKDDDIMDTPDLPFDDWGGRIDDISEARFQADRNAAAAETATKKNIAQQQREEKRLEKERVRLEKDRVREEKRIEKEREQEEKRAKKVADKIERDREKALREAQDRDARRVRKEIEQAERARLKALREEQEREEKRLRKDQEKAERERQKALRQAHEREQTRLRREEEKAQREHQRRVANGYHAARVPFNDELLTGDCIVKDPASPNYNRHYMGHMGNTTCEFCQALLFDGETSGLCCNDGKTDVSDRVPVPPPQTKVLLEGMALPSV